MPTVVFSSKTVAVIARETEAYQYQNMVSTVANTLHDVAGVRDGLAFIIDRIEQEPKWFRQQGRDGWAHHSSTLAYWRQQLGGKLGDLEPRLLKLVTDELREDLKSQRQRNRSFYYRHHSYFWREKTDAFAQVAEEVWQLRRDSGAAVLYIANYLDNGLDRCDRAIEMLWDAQRRDLLDENGQAQLVQKLHRRSRWVESIPLLKKLIDWRPDTLQYRLWLMVALHHSERKTEVRSTLAAADKHFHDSNRWQETVIAQLGSCCVSIGFSEDAVKYYREVIPLHQRTHPNRGVGSHALSGYYQQLSQAYTRLGQTFEAVETAAGAIVCWPHGSNYRTRALQALENVLRHAPDLDGYIGKLQAQIDASGLENPIIRKAAGKVYQEKREHAEAVQQLRFALDVQPNDTETRQLLIAAYDGLGDTDNAIAELYELASAARRNIEFYRQLHRRLTKLNRSDEAERVATTIVEALPAESESHTMLAEIRQQQDRWPDAIVQWQQVARIRELEPTGLQNLAAAQIHQKQWTSATKTVQKLFDKQWPERFGDVHGAARRLMTQIEVGNQ